MTEKVILDATCGSRMMWFDRYCDHALYMDKRVVDNETIWTSKDGKNVRTLTVDPDVVADFTDMPFEDETFYLVVFDPPHLRSISETAWLAKKYGRLFGGWENVIHDGFKECMRVLKPYGTLVFKWNENDIPIREVIDAIGDEPLFGTRTGKRGFTHWCVYMKFPKDGGVLNG